MGKNPCLKVIKFVLFETVKQKVLLFNPRSANSKHRIPNSVLQVAASIDGQWEWVFVDGNRESDPEQKIIDYLSTGEFGYFGATVMPGPQLRQVFPIVKETRKRFPHIINIWGGYFPSNQFQAVLNSGLVDYIIDGPGDRAFPSLLKAIEAGESVLGIKNLIVKENGVALKTGKEELLDQDSLPRLPYEKLDQFYSMDGYLVRTFLGDRTIAYHSSFGCPFTCSFCAVVPIYNARWKGKSAQAIYDDISMIRAKWGGDSVEFHDNNFFVSEKRTVEFAKLIKDDGMSWWGEARIDTLDKYSDASLALMRESGCKMIFFGAESGDDSILKQMDKGGKQTGAQIKSFAKRLRQFDIIPEYSFVLGTPAATPELAMKQINAEIQFIKGVKETNPDTEIIIYVYSPVPTEGSELYEAVKATGFRFPETLEDWVSPAWENFDLRKNPLTPWLKPEMVDRIKNFETVLNGFSPTVSDTKLTPFKRKVMRAVSSVRYKNDWYSKPYELKVLQKYWLRYRQPEIEGM